MRIAAFAMVALAAAPAAAQTPDPVTASLAAEWSATMTAQGHVQQALQRLIEAYEAEKAKPPAPAGPWRMRWPAWNFSPTDG